MKLYQFVHSTDLQTGGVAKAFHDLSDAFLNLGINSLTSEKTNHKVSDGVIIAHGLWQWPGLVAYQNW